MQLFASANPTVIEIHRAIAFADVFARLVSSITERDIWRLKSKLGRFSEEELVSIVSNLQARTFEDRVADYLRDRFHYTNVETRYKPPYLNGREIDVVASKLQIRKSTLMVICECKLVIGERAITTEEVAQFESIARKVKEVESAQANQRGETLKFFAWFVTNTQKVPNPHAVRIPLMIAKLLQNWLKMDFWKISKIAPAWR